MLEYKKELGDLKMHKMLSSARQNILTSFREAYAEHGSADFVVGIMPATDGKAKVPLKRMRGTFQGLGSVLLGNSSGPQRQLIFCLFGKNQQPTG